MKATMQAVLQASMEATKSNVLGETGMRL